MAGIVNGAAAAAAAEDEYEYDEEAGGYEDEVEEEKEQEHEDAEDTGDDEGDGADAMDEDGDDVHTSVTQVVRRAAEGRPSASDCSQTSCCCWETPLGLATDGRSGGQHEPPRLRLPRSHP